MVGFKANQGWRAAGSLRLHGESCAHPITGESRNVTGARRGGSSKFVTGRTGGGHRGRRV
jgi:hypothetical protein